MIDSQTNERNTHEHTQNTDTGAGEDRGEEREPTGEENRGTRRQRLVPQRINRDCRGECRDVT